MSRWPRLKTQPCRFRSLLGTATHCDTHPFATCSSPPARFLNLGPHSTASAYATHLCGAECAQRSLPPRSRCCAAVPPQWWCPGRRASWPPPEPLQLVSGPVVASAAVAHCARRARRPAGEVTRRTIAFQGTRETTTYAVWTSRTWATHATTQTPPLQGITRWRALSHATATPAATPGVSAASASAGTS